MGTHYSILEIDFIYKFPFILFGLRIIFKIISLYINVYRGSNFI